MAWKSQLNPASPLASPSGRSALTSPASSFWLESRRTRQEQVPRSVVLGSAVRPRANASPSSSASVPACETRGLRAHLASSSVPIDCHDDSSLVEG